MYNNIIENKEIMDRIMADTINKEVNLIILKALPKDYTYEQQLDVAKGLLLNDKETKKRKNKEEYEANKTRRQEKARNNGEQMTCCLKCDMKMKKNVLHNHIDNRVCITRQEELYGPLPTRRCELCRTKVKEHLYRKHLMSKKCIDRQEFLKELEEDEED